MKMSVMLSALLCLAVSAVQAAPIQPTFSVPNQVGNPANYQSLDNYGFNTYYVETSTPADTAVVLGSGPGLLYGVACSSGASGDYGIAYDSASATNSITSLTNGAALSPSVLSTINAVATCTQGTTCGQWLAPHGAARFTNGITFLKHGGTTTGSGGGERCLVQALFDANVNSASH